MLGSYCHTTKLLCEQTPIADHMQHQLIYMLIRCPFPGRCLCSRRFNIIHQRFRIRWHRPRCILLGWQNCTAQSRRVYHSVPRRVPTTVCHLDLAIFIAFFIIIMIVVIIFVVAAFIRNHQFTFPIPIDCS